ncbi:MAG: EamA family transporter [Nitriliruptorales bacterium]|nr:EamA family transporter [Nitriliruptorales bacterium]
MAAEPADRATATRTRPGASSAGSFLLVALSAALWGTDALFRRGLALELPAAAVVFGEHLILVLLTLPLLIGGLRATRSFNRADWASLVLIGAGASATATVLFTAAFALGDPTTPLLLQKVQPLIAIAGAWLLLGERPLRHYLVYLVTGIAGAYLISFPDPTNVSIAAFVPAVLALGAAALWGMGTVLGRHLTTKVAFDQLTALRFAAGLPASALLLWMLGGVGALGGLSGSDLLALLLLALVPGLLALLLYYRGLRGTPAAAATLAELAFPLSAVLVNYVAFGTTLALSQWLGVALLSGTITVMGIAGQRSERGLGVAVRRRTEPALVEQ